MKKKIKGSEMSELWKKGLLSWVNEAFVLPFSVNSYADTPCKQLGMLRNTIEN